MATTKSISGIQRGPDFEWETYEASRVERVDRSIKDDHNKQQETNDPLIRAAVDAGNEVASTLGANIDVKYDVNSGMIVMAVMSPDGKEIIKTIPPEEMIRQAQRQKERLAQYVESVI
jgi:uncharacterized FlaG/YvyC family protein